MKKLKRLKLHSAVVLQEKEMKAVQGGVNGECNPHGTLCHGACISQGRMGHCDRAFDVLGGLCGCVIMYVYDKPGTGYGYECEYGYWYHLYP